MATLILTVIITTAISLLAAYLMRPDSESPIQDSTPGTLASRGTFIPILLGRRRLGAIVGWVGGRTSKKEGGSGGKGSGGGVEGVKIYSEKGWHILCVGPAFALHRILQSGKTIWRGPINRNTTPSGSTINIGKKGSFRIYWGDIGQPIDGDLANRVVPSRWENICFVVWDRKRLGSSQTWPILDYEVEVRPEFSELLQSAEWILPTIGLADKRRDIYSIYGVGGPHGDHYIEIQNDHRKRFPPGASFDMAGNANNADGTYSVSSNQWDKARKLTRIHTVETLVDDIRTFYPTVPIYSPVGTIAQFESEDNDGCNVAHMLYQLMFSDYPQGLAIPTTHVNVASLEALGVAMGEGTGGERFLGHFLAASGQDALGAVAGIMQDVGVIFRFNTKVALFEFTLIREPTVTPPNLDGDTLVPPLPEIETVHGSRTSSRMMFKFKDRFKNFRAGAVNRDDDSLASIRGHIKVLTVEVPSATNHETVVQIANRREQEQFGSFSSFKVLTNKEGRALLPGDVLTVGGDTQILRILEVKLNPLSSKVELGCAIDFYGVPTSSFTDEAPGGDDPSDDSAGSTPFKYTEVPAFLKTFDNMDVIVPYLRGDANIDSGQVYFSRDDVTYQIVYTEQGIQTGGELRGTIEVSDPTFIDQGPEFEVIGPDIDNVLDLTGDDENWRLGRQLAVIGNEIFYLKKVTAISGNTFRLDGLIRARYDTVPELHGAGENVFIFDQRNVVWFSDLLLVPGKPLYVKVLPVGNDNIDLADIEPELVTVHGKGVVPMDPRNLRTVNMANTYKTGEDVPLKWAFMSAAFLNSAAGLQGAGDPHATPPVPGEFVVRLRTTGDVLVQEYNVPDPSDLIDNADLVTWFSGEPASFKVAVALVQSGYESDEIEITVTRV